MITHTRRWWNYLFHSPPKTALLLSEQEPLWKTQFSSLLDNPKSIDSLWEESLRLTRRSCFTPDPHQLEHIKSALTYLPRHCVNIQQPTTNVRASHTLTQLITKLWHNTLRLFTWGHQTKDLENRHFFDLGNYSVKIFDITRLVSALAFNQYTIELVCSALAVSTTAAYMATVAAVVALFSGALFFINRYAEYVLAKPLRDPTFGDTVNLTRLMGQSIPLSEAGRKQELDELESALTSPTAEVGIIGEKGCGKSELIKLLAQRIAQDSSTPHLKGKQIYCVNGAQVTRSYLEKLREAIKGHEGEIILCIDECHGIFRSGADQILKTLGMGGPKPRILYVTTKTYFESTFLAEEDGSWLSRIHPRLEIKPINPRDLNLILIGRLQNLLPWIKITPELIVPFADIARTDLRKAIKDLDLFAAYFLKKINSSHSLSQAIEEKAQAEADLTNLSLSEDYHVWLSSQESVALTEKIRRCEHQINEEKYKLYERQEQQKRYQTLDLLQKKWQTKTLAFSQNTQIKKFPEKEKHLYAACLWAGEVFERRKQVMARNLTTHLDLKEVTQWLSTQKSSSTPASTEIAVRKKSKSPQIKLNPLNSSTRLPSASISSSKDGSDQEQELE